MSLRVGYVNVCGLSKESWDACHRLLSTHVDLLFIAETWFVNHKLYTRDRRFIASTTAGAAKIHGRPHGGIYLIGSNHARSQVKTFQATEHTLTFEYGRHVISGVYFPPTTLDTQSMSSLLDSLAASTVIMGDINTRFRDPIHQDREAGPPERLQIFVDFLTRTTFQHMKPSTGTEKLTTDHCFVQPDRRSQLALVNAASVKIRTDHRYILCLTLGHQGAEEMQHQEIRRFRVGQLTNPDQVEALRDLIDRSSSPFAPGDDIDQMNAKLVQFCQEVQRQTIGVAVPFQKRTSRGPDPSRDEQTARASVRLYKSACRISEENDVIFPTPEAAGRGLDAVTENLASFRERWTGQAFQVPQMVDPQEKEEKGEEEVTLWTRVQVVEEIRKQEAEKSCGADGIHMRFLKTVQDTAVTAWLLQLYNRCLVKGKTPRAWNESEIYLLTKDPQKKRDATNLRPISIIGMFRKVFERLLLLRVQRQPWAKLHPAQAGFRRSYSTYSNAAVVHMLLTSKTRSTALFLDFKAAFDVVDHQRLDGKLARRGCPQVVRSLIQSLMFQGLKSRILINGRMTEWFGRSRGVLQGSPLSPWLWNLFVDDLLYQVNRQYPGLPLCLFYADDGVILASRQHDLVKLLRIVEDWSVENAIKLNPPKCGVVTSRTDLPQLAVYGQEIPQREAYTYLGFPVTSAGIDFVRHLSERVKAAVGRAAFLGIESKSWGPAHRLRVYKQFLAPMFEYGAPLVQAWVQEGPRNRTAFDHATAGFRELIAWIANTSDQRWALTSNFCGLSPLHARFGRLKTAYQWILERMEMETPLRQTLERAYRGSKSWSFAGCLDKDEDWACFKATSTFEPTVKVALGRYLRTTLFHTLYAEGRGVHLAELVPMESRNAPGLVFADVAFAGPVVAQGQLLQYRRGLFMRDCACVCGPGTQFSRGHEGKCPVLRDLVQLSRSEWQQKREMKAKLSLDGTKFTNIDFLLNTRQVKRVALILEAISKQLRQVHKENQLKEAQTNDEAMGDVG